MSQSFFKYETQEEIFERLKRLRVEMLKNQLRLARHFTENRKNAMEDNKGHAMEDRERSYSISDSYKSDELGEAVSIPDISDKLDDSVAMQTASGSVKRNGIDLSEYLSADMEFKRDGDIRLKEIIAGIDERVPDSDKAREEYASLMKNIKSITDNSSLDIEDMIRMVEQRVSLYIENRNYDNTALDEDLLLDYKALCILLGVDEQVLSKGELKEHVDRMLEEYSRISDKEVVAELTGCALMNLGMSVDGCCVLDEQMEGELYSMGDNKCKVFVSCSDSGIMIEPINADKDADPDEITSAQKKICAAERKLMEEAEKNGLILKKVYSNEHSLKDMAAENDLAFNGHVEDKALVSDNRFEKMRNYNRMRRNRRRVEKAREMRHE